MSDTHGRIFGDGDGATRVTRLRSAVNKTISPGNGLADNIIEVHHGKYLLTDSNGKNELLLNAEELHFIQDDTVTQYTASAASFDNNRASSSSSHTRSDSLVPPPARRSSTSEYGGRNKGQAKSVSDGNEGFSKNGNGRTTSPRQHLFRKKPLSSMEEVC